MFTPKILTVDINDQQRGKTEEQPEPVVFKLEHTSESLEGLLKPQIAEIHAQSSRFREIKNLFPGVTGVDSPRTTFCELLLSGKPLESFSFFM